MKLTLGQAAKQARKSKGTISNALKQGRLSGERQPDGSWSIDPAELQRWQEATRSRSQLGIEITTAAEPPVEPQTELVDSLRDQIETLKAALTEAKDDKAKLWQEVESLRGQVERLLPAPQKPTESFRARLGRWISGRPS